MANNISNSALWSSDRGEPLASGFAGMDQQYARSRKEEILNDRLNTDHIDVEPDDTSLLAKLTRAIAGFVGNLFTPRQVLIILRLLKALTFSFLCFTIVADLMYVFFVELFVSDEVANKVGGTRDIIVRIYGLGMGIIALLVELETSTILNLLPGLKPFIPRSLLLFFISTITSPNPLHESYSLNNEKNGGDDDANYDDKNGDDYDTNYDYDQNVSSEIPSSTVVFQMVSSFVLGICAICYFILGIFCFDRFTSKAFLTKKDHLKATAIPVPPTTVAVPPVIPVSPLTQIDSDAQSQSQYEAFRNDL